MDLARAASDAHARCIQEVFDDLFVGQHGCRWTHAVEPGSGAFGRKLGVAEFDQRAKLGVTLAAVEQLSQRSGLHSGAHDAVSMHWVGSGIDRVDQPLGAALECDSGRAYFGTFIGKHRGRHSPAAVQRPKQIALGCWSIVQEDLAELLITGHLLERSHIDTGTMHVEQEERDPAMTSIFRVGPSKQDPVVGQLGCR